MILKNCFFYSLVLLILSCSKDKMTIDSFEIANLDKTIDHNQTYVTENYLIHNWDNNQENELFVDSFVCENLREDYNKINHYFISFYKYSDNVNPEYYRKSRKLCELEMAEAVILCYEFRDGFFQKTKGDSKSSLKSLTDFNCKD